MTRLALVSSLVSLVVIVGAVAAETGLGAAADADPDAGCTIFSPEYRREVHADHLPSCGPVTVTFLGSSIENVPEAIEADNSILEETFDALLVLQREYFNTDYGTWPEAIDWTAAVAQTLLTGTLTTLSKVLGSEYMGAFSDWKSRENLISTFFDQVVGFYFAQDVLSIRAQAYDDILWVVLGWIEALKLVSTHSKLHYPRPSPDGEPHSTGLREMLETLPWRGHNWVPSFAHRSRIFWNLASHGWDTRLCRGGMNWNPRLKPYKNAITNELWIAGSIAMYRHFPGDNFTSPWLSSSRYPDRDPAHLAAAVDGYRWLMGVNMTNRDGLFVDGYHIDSRKPGNRECDLRDEMVYTYNQGVILTGQRELWAATGALSYLREGHELVQAVVKATGWSLGHNNPTDDWKDLPSGKLLPWRGLGRGGVLEESCDASGTRSQDGQTFKGIFFHHLTHFCETIVTPDNMLEEEVDDKVLLRIRLAHASACRAYSRWVRHNALAALDTRDAQGRFGMWWGANLPGDRISDRDDGVNQNDNMTDYRNRGTPADDVWGSEAGWFPGEANAHDPRPMMRRNLFESEFERGQQVLESVRDINPSEDGRQGLGDDQADGDPNSRNRGRSVETQIGGLAVLRAYWELSKATSLYGNE